MFRSQVILGLGGVVVIAALILSGAVTLAYGQQVGLTGATRDKFVGATIQTCTMQLQQVSTPENEKIPEGPLNSYCICIANDGANRVSDSLLRSLSGLSDEQRQAAMKPAMDASVAVCMPAFERALR
jgi:hypothetical protein